MCVQWLKRVDDTSDVRHNTTTLRVNGHALLELSRGVSQMLRSDGTFLSKLTLRDVSDSDAGLYICRAGNSAGHSQKEAHLIVYRGALLPDN